ncbi:hypothetical protein ACTVCO_08950 [Sanguibacter sp. A247]|uniref:hypothetical protein n=1 Tax=unclassified Sanguibacter TaxID=2645534 RepID=UPI003FD8ACD4
MSAFALRCVVVTLVAAAFVSLGPAVIAWFIVGPLLAASLVAGGTWAVLVVVALVGVSLASAEPGWPAIVQMIALPLAVHLSLLADAAGRSDVREAKVDVRLVLRSLRSTGVIAAVLGPVVVLVSVLNVELPGWVGVLAVLGVVGAGFAAVRVTSSSRGR